jgi:hypothetical protein
MPFDIQTAKPTVIARLKPTGIADEVRLGYWSNRHRWEDIDDTGGVVKPFDEGLAFIAKTRIFLHWT